MLDRRQTIHTGIWIVLATVSLDVEHKQVFVCVRTVIWTPKANRLQRETYSQPTDHGVG